MDTRLARREGVPGSTFFDGRVADETFFRDAISTPIRWIHRPQYD
jgi:hypothetical protein